MAEPTKTFRDHVADTLLDQIRNNTAPWQKPCDSGTIREAPYNPVSGKPYQGIRASGDYDDSIFVVPFCPDL